MKILFTVVSFKTGPSFSNNYLNATKKLAKNIIDHTSHDLLITTNDKSYFNDIESARVTVRDNISPDLILFINSEFNYNSKYEAFVNLPKTYDVIFYLDGDIELTHWNKDSEDFLDNIFKQYEYGASRLNATFSFHYNNFKSTNEDLFKHKFVGHDLTDVAQDDIINQSRLPSEHFLIFKYDEQKLNKFAESWKQMCFYLQNKNNPCGTLCDGFEIGISVTKAGITNLYEIYPGDSVLKLGLNFNGNKI